MLDPVLAHLHPGRQLEFPQPQGVVRLAAPDDAFVGLLVLVALRPAGESRRRREVIQAVVDHIGAGAAGAGLVAGGPFAGQAVAVRLAAVAARQRAETADLAAVDGALGHMLGGGPVRPVSHRRDGETVAGAAPGQARHAVALAQIGRQVPRAVVAGDLDRAAQVEALVLAAAGRQQAAVPVRAHGQVDKRRLQHAQVIDARRAGVGKIAVLGRVHALAIIDVGDQFRDQEIQVHIPLAVRVAGDVGRHADDGGGEIAAVVEVEAAQEILVGLAVARMLGDDHARYRLQQFGGAQQRPRRQLLRRHRAVGGGIGDADQAGPVAGDGYFRQGRHAGRAGQFAAGQQGGQQRCLKINKSHLFHFLRSHR